MRLVVTVRRRDKVILTSASRGRILALHKHRTKRVRKKYLHAVVFLREFMTCASLSEITKKLQEHDVMSERAWRRFCTLARKCGVQARMERSR
jgi:hypothetical protein